MCPGKSRMRMTRKKQARNDTLDCHEINSFYSERLKQLASLGQPVSTNTIFESLSPNYVVL
jgi:hypothetical protein